MVTDVDNTTEYYRYRVQSLPVAGTIELDGTPFTTTDTFTYKQLSDGVVKYLRQGGEAESDTIQFIVSDGVTDSTVETFEIQFAQEANLSFSIEFTHFNLPENASGAVAGRVSVIDRDQSDIAKIEVSDDRFIVIQGQLRLKNAISLDFEQEPTVNLRIKATDMAGAIAEDSVFLQVEDRNDAPELSGDATVSKDSNYELPDNLFVDSDGDFLTYSATLENGEPLPDWLRFDTVDKVFHVIDTERTVLSLDVVVHAADGRGGETSVPVRLFFDPLLSKALPEAVAEDVYIPEILPSEVAIPPLSNQASEQEAVVLKREAADTTSVSRIVVESAALDVVQTIDLHSLIKPLPVFQSLQLEPVGLTVTGQREGQEKTLDDVDTYNLSDLLNLPQSDFLNLSDSVSNALDASRDDHLERVRLSQAYLGSSAGFATGLSVGYLLWLTRGGALLSSMLSSLPAWRFVDPLPVLNTLTDEKEDSDDESLASMVEAPPVAPQDNDMSQAGNRSIPH